MQVIDGSASKARSESLESRRFNADSYAWAAAQTLRQHVPADSQMNASGEVLVLSTHLARVHSTAVNLGGAWQPSRPIDDLTVCAQRETVSTLDDQGVAVVGQICLSENGAFPMFVRAQRFGVR